MAPPKRSRDIKVSAAVLRSLKTYAGKITFWVAAPNSCPETRGELVAALLNSLVQLHLAGQPLQVKVRIFEISSQQWRICVDVNAAPGQAEAVLELLDPETATVRLPA